MPTINEPLNRKLRMGLVGGGGRSFIGPVHYMAATMDHRALPELDGELVTIGGMLADQQTTERVIAWSLGEKKGGGSGDPPQGD